VNNELSFSDIDRLTGGRPGEFRVRCPVCGPKRSRPRKAKLRVLKIWVKPDFASYACGHCQISGYAIRDGAARLDHQQRARLKAEAAADSEGYGRRQRDKARWLYSISRPWSGTLVETYLRSRCVNGPLPATIRFLSPRKAGQHPAMIVPYGIPDEPEPGVLSIAATAISAAHLTFLRPDGKGKAEVADDEPEKITVGSPGGMPLVLAPVNDLLGLAITEGVEDSLSAHEATGLGAWAAGCASFMPALADIVPNYIDSTTILADDDDDGRRHAGELARRLRARKLEVRLILPSKQRAAA
jgi:hypothetical protein